MFISTQLGASTPDYFFPSPQNSPPESGNASGRAVNPSGVSMLLKSHMHLTQYVDQVCIICGSVKVTLCPLMRSIDGVRTCTTPSTHISVDLVIVL